MEHGTTTSKNTPEGWVTYACASLFRWTPAGRGTYGHVGSAPEAKLKLPEDMNYWPRTIEVKSPRTGATQIFKLGSIEEEGKYLVAFYSSKEGNRLELFTRIA